MKRTKTKSLLKFCEENAIPIRKAIEILGQAEKVKRPVQEREKALGPKYETRRRFDLDLGVIVGED